MLRRMSVAFLATAALALVPRVSSAQPVGAVYTMSNAAAGNEVIVFARDPRGALAWSANVPTGGLGSGAGLGNQGAVALSDNDRWLFVVNPGSHDLSVFAVEPGGLRLVDRKSTGGMTPISVSASGRLVYVLNGGTEDISGFAQRANGTLVPLPGSTRSLSGSGVGPAEIKFSPDGRLLVVSEKMTSLLTVYEVGFDGLPGDPTSYPSSGQTPFGFDFGTRGQLLVSEAAGGAAGQATVSSYMTNAGGTPELASITPALATGQSAACWLVVSKGGRLAFITNTGSNTVSALTIDAAGRLTLVGGSGVAAPSGMTPIDATFSGDGRFLYVLNGGDHSISAYRVHQNGTLTPLSGIPANGVPPGTNGLAAQ